METNNKSEEFNFGGQQKPQSFLSNKKSEIKSLVRHSHLV